MSSLLQTLSEYLQAHPIPKGHWENPRSAAQVSPKTIQAILANSNIKIRLRDALSELNLLFKICQDHGETVVYQTLDITSQVGGVSLTHLQVSYLKNQEGLQLGPTGLIDESIQETLKERLKADYEPFEQASLSFKVSIQEHAVEDLQESTLIWPTSYLEWQVGFEQYLLSQTLPSSTQSMQVPRL